MRHGRCSLVVSAGLAAVALVAPATAGTATISTVAGNGSHGVSNDGERATEASLEYPYSVAIGPDGALYLSETVGNRVRRVDPTTGTLSTAAGAAGYGTFAGDGGPATEARLNGPRGLAFDADGNLYIADTYNDRVRVVDRETGIISTVAGSDVAGYFGDGGPATDASLWQPTALAFDQEGDLYVADWRNHVIRKVNGDSGTIETFAGTGARGFEGDGGPATSAALSMPYGVAIDSAGNLFIGDQGNHRVRRVDGDTGVISTVAGDGLDRFAGDGGPAASASLHSPTGLGFDSSDDLYVADTGNGRIRRIVGGTGSITTVAGNGLPTGIAVAYAAFLGVLPTSLWGTLLGDGGPATDAVLTFPSDVKVAPSGEIFIADTLVNRVRRVADAQ